MNNWQIEKLGEVCDIINGSTPLRSNKEFWDDGDVPWFTIDDIREQGRSIKSTKQKITNKALGKMSARLLPRETVLLCCTASVGEYAITEIELTTNQQFNGLVSKNKKILNPFFLFYFSATLKDQLLGLSGKTTIDFIPISRLKNIEIPLPPLSEQKRIVKILDEVFKNVAKAKENAEKNLKNSKELFESYLQNIFKNPERSWKKKGISDVCEVISGGTPKTNIQKYWDGNLCWVTPKDLGRVNSDIISDTSRKITQEGLKKSSAKLLPVGSVILSSRAPIGYVVINAVAMATNQGCKSFICGHQIYNKFLYYFLISNTEYLNSLGSGTTFKEISGGVLKNIKISLPSLSKQKAIVKKLDALSAETKKLEGIYQQKLADLEELKKSVLKSAFAGEL